MGTFRRMAYVALLVGAAIAGAFIIRLEFLYEMNRLDRLAVSAVGFLAMTLAVKVLFSRRGTEDSWLIATIVVGAAFGFGPSVLAIHYMLIEQPTLEGVGGASMFMVGFTSMFAIFALISGLAVGIGLHFLSLLRGCIRTLVLVA